MLSERHDIGQTPMRMVGVIVERIDLDHRHARSLRTVDISVDRVAHVEGPSRRRAQCLEGRGKDSRIGLRDAEIARPRFPIRAELSNREYSPIPIGWPVATGKMRICRSIVFKCTCKELHHVTSLR